MIYNEPIKNICRRREMTVAELARRTGQTRQNLWIKQSHGKWRVLELKELAKAMGGECEVAFVFPDGEKYYF